MPALALPDVPRWVEAHGIASDPAHWLQPVGAGQAIGHDRAKLIVVFGEADPPATRELAAAYPQHALLVASEREDLIAALRDTPRTIERARLHTLDEPDALPDLDGATLLPGDAALPAPLAAELTWARERALPIWTVYVDDEPQAFAYAPWRSASWFDVSVDVLPGARQLGLGTLVASAMIRDERARGREPVWGANESNQASLRLAARLGFRAVDELWVA